MTTLPTLPPLPDVTETRTTLHRLAEDCMAAAQMAAIGTIRLHVTDQGFATRWFPDASGRTHRLRVFGADLLREYEDGATETEAITGTFDPSAADALYAWSSLGWQALSDVVAGAGEQLSDLVLWPEHFDAGVTLTLADGRHLNLGFSPGDEFSASPYLYAGPWETFSGDFWNAPFGAYRTYEQVADGLNPATLFAEAREMYGAAR